MATEEQIRQVDCPSCHAVPNDYCVDRSGVMVPNHVARRRRYKRLVVDSARAQ